MDKTRLHIKAHSILDIHIMSSLIEKSVFYKRFYKYDKKKKTLNFFLNRFCWELDPNPYDHIYYRNSSNLTFKNVIDVKNNFSDSKFKSIFCMICTEKNLIKLILNQDFQIDIYVSKIDVSLLDTKNFWIIKNKNLFKN